MDGVVGRVKAPAAIRTVLGLLLHAVELGREQRAGMHRAGAKLRLGGMRREAGDPRQEGADALVGIGDVERGRLADDDGGGARQGPAHRRDAVDHAEAGDLLVIGEEEMDRRRQPRAEEVRYQRQGQRDEALHVDGASTIGPPVRDMQREGIPAPGLPLDRHDIGVAGQHDAAAVLRADGGEQRRLVARLVGEAGRGDAPAGEIVLDEVDQRQVGFVAHRVEGDQAGEHLERRVALPGGRGGGQCRTFFT